MLAASVAYDWTRWEVEGTVGGAAVNAGGNKVAYIDLDAAVRYVLFRSDRWGAQAALGYKLIAMDLELEEDSANAFEADLSFNGPYAGLRLLF